MDGFRRSGIAIDCVVTHTGPSFCFPRSKSGIEGWLAHDTDLDNEKAVMDNSLSSVLGTDQSKIRGAIHIGAGGQFTPVTGAIAPAKGGQRRAVCAH